MLAQSQGCPRTESTGRRDCVAQAAAEGGEVAEQKVREASNAIARLVKS